MDPAIRASELSVVFAPRRRKLAVTALDGVELAVPAGHLLGILGPNGSGKTTLLRILAGLQRPTRGRAEVLGRPPVDRALIPRVGYQPEGPLPWPNLTGREHLRHMGMLQGLSRSALAAAVDTWIERMGLAHAAHRRVRTYSTGMVKRLGLAAALMGDPEVLLLDEPTAGLDPDGSHLVIELLRERAAVGVAVVLASHQLLEVEAICDSVVVLVDGVVRARGSLDELLATERTQLAVRDLAPDRVPDARAALAALGAEVVDVRPERRHLHALFRQWIEGPR